MNPQLRQFEKESKLEIFGLGAKRHIWEAALEKYAELIVKECSWTVRMTEFGDNMTQEQIARHIEDHFKVEE
jgi:hypothetical protein